MISLSRNDILGSTVRTVARLSVMVISMACGVTHATDYQIGVFYFPGWKSDQEGAPSRTPWKSIQAYPEREPMLGWYDDGDRDVIQKQLQWMRDYGIDYVVFDWYFIRGRKVVLEHSLATYMQSDARKNLKFSILWANHSDMPESMEDWQAMVGYWVKYYFPRNEFLRMDDKPVVFVFSSDEFRKQVEKFGATPKQLIDEAQRMAKGAGFPGINFVAGGGAYLSVINGAKDAGYAAMSTYNYHQGPVEPLKAPSRSYSELDAGYRAHWKRFRENPSLPLIVPMMSGWDKRPWGGSRDAAHDDSMSSPKEFRTHLQAAKAYMDENPEFTRRMGVICCWNEFGEGSFIEPTKKNGFSYLEIVRDVFGK